VVSNEIIHFDDESSATVRSRFTVFQATDEVPLQPIIMGSYRDRFELRDEQWRLVERHMEPRLFGDLSGHLKFDPEIMND
jgi:hypothetical protein